MISVFYVVLKVTWNVFVLLPNTCQKKAMSVVRWPMDGPDLSDRMLKPASWCQSGGDY